MIIYKKDSKGNIRYLDIEADGSKIVQRSGILDTENEVEHVKVAKPKNIGKTNATTAEQQAVLEVESILTSKLKEGYFTSIADAEATGRIFQRAETDKACPSNTYKVALVIAPGVDYHWYRQNPDGTWSHKPGHTEVTNEDASGKTIKDPQRADRNYNEIGVNYSEFRGYYCTGSK